jgi:hypothetical protein
MTPPDDPTPTRPDGSAQPPLPGDPGHPAGSAEAPAIETATPGKLRQRVIPDPPEMDQKSGGRAFLFVLALVLVTALILGAVLALNVVADPYGSVGTHFFPTVTTTDRTVKADRIVELRQPPQLVVLGSSRAMRYDPSYLMKLTGQRTFNASVNGIGGTTDAWAMTQFIHEVWPDSHPAYLWLVDVESFVPIGAQGRTAAEPRLAKYVDAATAGRGAAELAKAIWQNRTTLFSLATAKDSARVILFRDKATTTQSKYRRQILADGALKQRAWKKTWWNAHFPSSVLRYSNLYRNVYKQPDAASQRYFEKTLAFMNEQGATPLIALTPINPKLRAIIAPLGWDVRHRQVVAYIESLQTKYRFKFVDLTDPSVFGFAPKQFFDGVHMTTINTEKAIRYILRQTGGIPPVRPPAGGK